MALMNTYGDPALTLVRGAGVYVWDANDRRYLDALSGIAVCGLGHAHAGVAAAICQQANTLLHTSNLYRIEAQVRLAAALTRVAGMERVFFSNSGAEANEAAIKLARKYAHSKAITAPEIITCEGSFHGRTLATLTATGNKKIKEGYAPLVSGFVHVPYNDVAAVAAAGNANTVAILVEPIQGEGGIRVPAPDYLQQLRKLCDERGWLLMLDEIQSGNGRTGRYFAYQHTTIKPDVVTTAKGLGNGVPIGACLANGAAAELFQPGSHGSTFGGNPLACSAALAVLDALADGELLANAQTLGAAMLAQFKDRLAGNAKVVDIRGHGLLLGIELDRPCAELVGAGRDRGLLLNVTAGNTIRLLPPLIIEREHADTIVATVVDLINAL